MGKILFDITPASWIANGSGVYTRYIFEQIILQSDKVDAFYLDENNFDNNLTSLAKLHGCKIVACKTVKEIEELINRPEYTKVYFGALKNTDIKLRDDITPIITVHDLRFIEISNDQTRHLYSSSLFKEVKLWISNLLNLQLDKKRQRNRISKFIYHPKLQIITVSNHTRYSIIQFFPFFPKENIHLFYCPLPLPITREKEENTFDFNKKFGLKEGSYFLIVSANRWFKNSYRAIQALNTLISNNQLSDKKVVVLGASKAPKIKHVHNLERFIFLDYVSFEELQGFYKNAFAFIYPSLQEGFGIPPLEAMRYSTPVLASVNSSIVEICEGGVQFFNPFLETEIGNRILHLLNDVNFYNDMKQRAKNRAMEISARQASDLKKQLAFILEE